MSLKEVLEQITAGGLDFQPQTALNISDLAEVTIERVNDGSKDFHTPVAYIIQSDSQIYYRWDASSGNTLDTAKDLKLSADDTHTIKVPFNLLLAQDTDASIYLHFQQVNTASNKEIRYVEV